LNIPEGKGEPITPLEKNLEEACDPAQTFLSPGKPEAVPILSCEMDGQKPREVTPALVPDESTAPVEYLYQRHKTKARDRCIRWAMAVFSASRSLGGWLVQWALLGLMAWRQAAMFLRLSLTKWISTLHSYRLKPLRLPHVFLDRGPLILSALRRAAALLLGWLRQPINAVHGGLVKSLRFSRFSLPRRISILPAWRFFGRPKPLSSGTADNDPATPTRNRPGSELTAFLIVWLKKPIDAVQFKSLRFPHFSLRRRISILPVCQSLSWGLTHWRDQLPFLGPLFWRRLAAFLILWLKKPVGTVHWCQVDPRGFLTARPLHRK
jgi:hypothetical protein